MMDDEDSINRDHGIEEFDLDDPTAEDEKMPQDRNEEEKVHVISTKKAYLLSDVDFKTKITAAKFDIVTSMG